MVFVFERLSLFGEQSELEENNGPTTLSVMIEIFKDHKEILLESFICMYCIYKKYMNEICDLLFKFYVPMRNVFIFQCYTGMQKRECEKWNR